MCEFCTTDRDGYSRYLPHKGTGNAHIRVDLWEGPIISVSGPHHTSLNIPINFCPKCGRRLKEEIL